MAKILLFKHSLFQLTILISCESYHYGKIVDGRTVDAVYFKDSKIISFKAQEMVIGFATSFKCDLYVDTQAETKDHIFKGFDVTIDPNFENFKIFNDKTFSKLLFLEEGHISKNPSVKHVVSNDTFKNLVIPIVNIEEYTTIEELDTDEDSAKLLFEVIE